MSKKQKSNTGPDRLLIDILACPDCKGDVDMAGAKVVCKKCGKSYPLINGVPVMLIDEAKNVGEKDISNPRPES